MDADFAKTMAMLGGQSAQSFDARTITEQDKVIIKNAIEELFAGLSLQQWLGGVTLQDAWSQAFDKMRDMTFAISTVNAMTRHVWRAVFDFIRIKRSQLITVQHPKECLNCQPEQRIAWTSEAESKIHNSIEIIKQKITAFGDGGTQATETQKQFRIPAQQQIHDHIKKQEKEREMERVREP